MRDLLMNEEYFINYVNFQNKRIEKFEALLEKSIKDNGIEFKGVRTGQLALLNFYLNKATALYSAGESIEKIKELYPLIQKYFVFVWNKEGSYSILLKVLSLGILLNISMENFQELIFLVKNEKMNDCLINRLLHYIDNSVDTVNISPLFEPYIFLDSILLNDNGNNQSLLLLQDYLENKWYKGHKDCGWYDSHKSNQNTYCGYWSFETAAVAKILNIDDGKLKNTMYYPYDLAHFES